MNASQMGHSVSLLTSQCSQNLPMCKKTAFKKKKQKTKQKNMTAHVGQESMIVRDEKQIVKVTVVFRWQSAGWR